MTIILAVLIGLFTAGIVNKVSGGKQLITLLAWVLSTVLSVVWLIVGGIVLGVEVTVVISIVLIVFLLFKTNQLKKKEY